MIITVKCANLGKDETFEITDVSMTVGQLKEMIAERCPTVPAELQRLIFAGRILKDFQTIEQCSIVDGATVHMVKGSARRTDPAPSAATTAAPSASSSSTASASSVPPMGGMGGGMPMGLGGLPMGGMGGMPSQANMMQYMLQNPQVMQEFMNSPLVESMISNPEFLRSMMASNPETRRLMESNPQISQMLNDPEMMRQALNAMRNPEARRQMMRSADMMMNHLDAMPGGFDALQRAYTQVGEPLLDAMSSSSGPAEPPAPEQYPPPPPSANPSSAPMPDPWSGASGSGADASGSSSSSSAAPGANPFGISPEMMNSLLGTMGGADAGAGAGGMPFGMTPETAMRMMENPLIREQANALAQNPELIRSLVNSPLFSNIPGAEMFRQNPELLARMMQPENLRAVMQLQSMFAPSAAGGSSSTASASGSSSTSAPLFGGFPMASQAPPDTTNYEELYATQLAQLEEMGFTDRRRNIQALKQTQGNVQFAVSRLLQ